MARIFEEIDNFQMAAEKMRIPGEVKKQSTQWVIEVISRVNGKLITDLCVNKICPVWITARQAFPHTDPGWKGQVFLTFVIRGQHFLKGRNSVKAVDSYDENEEKSGNTFLNAGIGQLILFDPMIEHWLQDDVAYQLNKPPSPWIALQWELPRRNYKKTVRAVVEKLSAMNQ